MCKECLQTPEGLQVTQALRDAEEACRELGTTNVEAYIAHHGMLNYTERSKELLEHVGALREAVEQMHARCRIAVAQAEIILKRHGYTLKRQLHYTWRVTPPGRSPTCMSCHQVRQAAHALPTLRDRVPQILYGEQSGILQGPLWESEDHVSSQ